MTTLWILSEPPVELIARLNHREQANLKQHLSKEAYSKERVFRGTKLRGPEKIANKKELNSIVSEIIETSREGVRIAPYTETHDLHYIFSQLGREFPVTFKDDERAGYKFFLVGVTFNILLSKDQFAKSAEFELVIADDINDPIHKTRPIYLFPARKDKTYFNADLEGIVAIDTNMNFHIPLSGSELIPFGEFQMKASAELKTKIVAEYKYQYRKAAIEVVGENDIFVRWRYNMKSELDGANMFKSFLIMKTPKEAKFVKMTSSLAVVPAKKKWLGHFGTKLLPALPANCVLHLELKQ
jgi:hypothetical protein